ncbi:lipocalin family protein [Pseudoxanthomonas sp. SL93]|uniref:lipocalin family protein n=1 Tax=Pseudoxanthomonas sp. SL93 TaxID=2995142 RepID=UPI00226DAE60|nr:lipocalin family protein [Pseudoxanthomonas sp. SL93]WAC62858.1 lipocalin family protein [Pseudoxanthomonas sp. SL93]
MSMPRPVRTFFRVVIAGVALLVLAACASQPTVATRNAVDLPRFMGTWHVIAHIPYFAERGHVASREEYTLRDSDKIAVRYVYQEGFNEPVQELESRGSVKAGTGNREWTLRFYAVIPAKLRILEVAPDYSWALIDYPGRDMGWIFGREPVMDDALYAELVKKMRDHGVNARQLVRVPQVPEQVGKEGFAPPKVP